MFGNNPEVGYIAKPDLIAEYINDNNESKFGIIDYKSRLSGANQSLYQSYMYKRAFESLAIDYYEALEQGLTEEAEKLQPFSRFVSKNTTGEGSKYISNIDRIEGFDFRTGKIVRLNQEEMTDEKMMKYFESIQGKQQEFNEGYIQGWDELKRQMASEYGWNRRSESDRQKYMMGSSSDRVRQLGFTSAGDKGYNQALDFYRDQYNRDVENLQSAEGQLYKAERRVYGKKEGPYNPYGALQSSIYGLFDDNTYAAMKQLYAGTPMEQMLDEKIKARDDARFRLNNLLQTDVMSSATKEMNEIDRVIHGVKESNALSTYNSIKGVLNRAIGAREALKNDPKYFDKETNSWLHDIRESATWLQQRDKKGNLRFNSKGEALWVEDKNSGKKEIDQTKYNAEKARATNAMAQENAYEKGAAKIDALQSKIREILPTLIDDTIKDVETETNQLLGTKLTKDQKLESRISQRRKELQAQMIQYRTTASELREEALKSIDPIEKKELDRLAAKYEEEESRINGQLQGEEWAKERKRLRQQADLSDMYEQTAQKRSSEELQALLMGASAPRSTMRELQAINLGAKIYDTYQGLIKEGKEIPDWMRPYVTKNTGDVDVSAIKATLAATAAQEQDLARLGDAYRSYQAESQYRKDLFQYGRSRTKQDRNIFKNARLYNMQQYSYWHDKHESILANKSAEESRLASLQNQLKVTTNESERNEINNQIAETQNRINSLGKDAKVSADAMRDFGSGMGFVKTSVMKLSESLDYMARRLGMQLLRKMLREAWQSIKQFDQAMTEMQMVTLKSDEQIEKLGDSLIKTAKNLKTPIKSVTDAATALYRQGLDDAGVQSRLEEVLKFSTTSGVKTQDAIKLITVSLSSGMVESSKEAMDIISALGDSAATTANDITKGLQKSIYAASQVGVSYGELVSMLTALTANTQLGGNIAGTAMQTFMGRYAKVGKSDIMYDEDGNEISGSDLALIFKSMGIDVYKDGNLMPFTQAISKVSKQWNSLSDIKQNEFAHAFGGQRQYSNLNSLMAAFSELDENGVTAIDKYLKIIDGSVGATDAKFESYVDSLNASLTE